MLLLPRVEQQAVETATPVGVLARPLRQARTVVDRGAGDAAAQVGSDLDAVGLDRLRAGGGAIAARLQRDHLLIGPAKRRRRPRTI